MAKNIRKTSDGFETSFCDEAKLFEFALDRFVARYTSDGNPQLLLCIELWPESGSVYLYDSPRLVLGVREETFCVHDSDDDVAASWETHGGSATDFFAKEFDKLRYAISSEASAAKLCGEDLAVTVVGVREDEFTSCVILYDGGFLFEIDD